MLLSLLIQIPLFGVFLISCVASLSHYKKASATGIKAIALLVTTINLVLSFTIWILFDSSDKHYQFIQEHHNIGYYDVYLGLDGLSVFFVLLTTIIFPLSILSNWKSIKNRPVFFLILMLLLESALLLIFLVLDILMFYIFFESILAPLFIMIGLYGSTEKIRAGFYFFLYTFIGSLFMLLSIVSMLSLTGCTDFDILSKTTFLFHTQVFMFVGIFIAFAVKTPVIFLNSWLLKAHVESPLSGSILLAAIVLKLSLYGVFRLVLPILPKAVLAYTPILFVICVATIIYASLSTIRTIDVKELIAYSSVSHAAVYLAGIVSNTIHGIQGGIILGLAHGFVSSGLFMTAGGVLYDRSGTRLITYYAGISQIMPILSILFFILSLGNCGAPLTLNFVGEFMSLYGVFERLPIAGISGATSIVFSAAYTIYMYNRIALGGVPYSLLWTHYMPDLKKREFSILITLVILVVSLGIYPSLLTDGLNYDCTTLLASLTTHRTSNSGGFAYEELVKLMNDHISASMVGDVDNTSLHPSSTAQPNGSTTEPDPDLMGEYGCPECDVVRDVYQEGGNVDQDTCGHAYIIGQSCHGCGTVPDFLEYPTEVNPDLPNGDQQPDLPNGDQHPNLPNGNEDSNLPNGNEDSNLPNGDHDSNSANGVSDRD